MDKLEMIERLSAKAGVSFDEAREALEKSDWDLLDALLLLQEQGASKDSTSDEKYSTQKKQEYNWNGARRDVKSDFSTWTGRFWAKFKELLHKGNTNQFIVNRKGEELISMPITVLVLLLICFWPFSLIILFAGLFLKARYRFAGPDVSEKINAVMGAAQDKAASAVQAHRSSNADKRDE